MLLQEKDTNATLIIELFEKDDYIITFRSNDTSLEGMITISVKDTYLDWALDTAKEFMSENHSFTVASITDTKYQLKAKIIVADE